MYFDVYPTAVQQRAIDVMSDKVAEVGVKSGRPVDDWL